jgi:DNA primase
MTNWIDFKELRKQLDFAEVLRHYGVELKMRDEQHHGFCPLPSHEGKKNSASFSANIKRGIWQCFGCGKKGNVLDFAVLMERGNPESGEDVQRIASQLRERFLGDSFSPKAEPKQNEDENVLINAPLDFELKGLDATHPYLFNRGFKAETIERFALGYCTRGLLANRVAIPLHNADGKLVGYAGRVVDDKTITEENPKYKFPGRRKREEVMYEFRKSLLVYNAHRIVVPEIDVVVVEGFAAVWWLWQADIPNVVAMMGASCSKEQGQIIVSLLAEHGRVWIFTDGDPAGERCANDIFTHVAPHRFVRWVKLESGEQPTALSPEMLQRLLPIRKRGDC